MAGRRELLSAKKKELLGKGYTPGIVQKALDWAEGSANGMADYYTGGNPSPAMVTSFLPKYLEDCEKWIKSIVGEPEKPQP